MSKIMGKVHCVLFIALINYSLLMIYKEEGCIITKQSQIKNHKSLYGNHVFIDFIQRTFCTNKALICKCHNYDEEPNITLPIKVEKKIELQKKNTKKILPWHL